MSSNLELKRICQHCGKHFIAKKTNTKFCSLECGQRNYKIRERINKITASNAEIRKNITSEEKLLLATTPIVEKHFINIKMLAFTIGVSERTLFRLIKNTDFPRLKIGRRLLFHKESVITYISNKYGMYFF